jgi:hypothetical protein
MSWAKNLDHERRAFMQERFLTRMYGERTPRSMAPLRHGLWAKTAAQRSADVEYNAKLDTITCASLVVKEQADIDILQEGMERLKRDYGHTCVHE